MNNTNTDNGFFSNFLKPNKLGNEARKIFIKYTLGTVIVCIAAAILLNIINNSGTSEYNIQKYFFLYALPLIFVIAITLGLLNNTNTAKTFLKLLGLIIILIGCVYFYATSTDTLNLNSLTNYFLFIVICIVGLALVYQLVINYMQKLKGVPGFIAQLIFYIPCIFLDVWLYLLQQVRLTPYSIYLLLFFMIILVIVYAYLPYITDKVVGTDDSIQLLTNIEYLDKKQVLTSSDNLKVQKTDENKYAIDQTGDYLRNYCISMWVYINPQSYNRLSYDKETEIFNYSFTDEEGIQRVKPMIRYYGGGGGRDQLIERNKYVFYFSKYPPTNQYAEDNHTFYDLTIENQKWNQIVLNYNRNKVDLYINGNLERTFPLNKDMPTYNDLDNITIGDENGLDGAICNVTYYKHSLTADQIALTYNTMLTSNLPIPRKKDNKSD